MRKLKCLFVVLVVSAWSVPARAAFNEEFFTALVRNELKERSKSLEREVDRAEAKTRFGSVDVRVPTQSEVAGLTAVQRASAAIKTDIEGAEAGLQIAPFLSSGEPWSGLSLSLAALEDSVTQVGAGIAWAHQEDPGRLADLQDEEGRPLRAQWKLDVLAQTLESRRGAYRAICAILDTLPVPSGDAKEQATHSRLVQFARSACTGEGTPSEATFSWGLAQLGAFLNNYLKVMKGADEATHSQANTILGKNAKEIEAIRSFEFEAFEKNPDSEEIQRAVEKWRWTRTSIRYGAGLQAQFFPLLWGFNPKCEGKEAQPQCQTGKLSTKDLQPRGEVAWSHQGTEVIGGLGLAFAREERAGKVSPAVTPKFAVSQQLTSPGVADTPRAIVGLEASVRVNLDRPDTQKELVSKVDIVPHLDIVVSDKLSFRLGVPLRAKLAKREADEAQQISEEQALQWSVPAFIATVLKM